MHAHMNAKNILVFLAVLAIGVGIGVFAEKTMVTSRYRTELVKLQSQIERARGFFAPIPETLNMVSGVVTDVSGNVVTIETAPLNPLDDLPRVRRITISGDTNILMLKVKASVVSEEAVPEHPATGGRGLPPGVHPDFYDFVSGSRSDVQRGQLIAVVAGEDIKYKDSFLAREIRITAVLPIPSAE